MAAAAKEAAFMSNTVSQDACFHSHSSTLYLGGGMYHRSRKTKLFVRVKSWHEGKKRWAQRATGAFRENSQMCSRVREIHALKCWLTGTSSHPYASVQPLISNVHVSTYAHHWEHSGLITGQWWEARRWRITPPQLHKPTVRASDVQA